MFKCLLKSTMASAFVVGVLSSAAFAQDAAQYDAEGQLKLPTDYREWVFVGANTSPHELNDGKAPFNEMRAIYIDRDGYDYWKTNGTFKDGTFLIKEVMSATRYEGTTGNGYAAGDIVALAAMVKDSKRFAEDTGQWGFFRFPKMKDSKFFTNVSGKYGEDRCSYCHEAAASETDMVFLEHYPVLRDAQGTGISGVPVKPE